jgi:hypothetical protein
MSENSRCYRTIKTATICILILVAAEFLVGMLMPSFYDPVVRNANDSDARVYAPNIRAAYRDTESGALLRVRTNHLGFRDIDRPMVKQPGVMDIVVLGNSFIAAHQVRSEERLTNLLERKITLQGRKARVFNFGIQGQNAINHMDLALFSERAFSPDFIVFFLTVDSDFLQDNLTTFRENRKITYVFRTNAVVREDEEIGPEQLFARRIRNAIYGLWLVRIAYQTYLQTRTWLASVGTTEKFSTDQSCPTTLRGNSTASKAPFQITRAILADLYQLVGDRLLVVLLPSQTQFLPTKSTETCNWDFVEHWLNELSQLTNIHTLSLQSVFQAQTQPVFLPGGHLSHLGHEVVASALFSKILSLRPGRD